MSLGPAKKMDPGDRRAMHSEMRLAKNYDPSDILLEGDLDEIVSHLVLQALKNCDPVSGAWNAHIQMVAGSPVWIFNFDPFLDD